MKKNSIFAKNYTLKKMKKIAFLIAAICLLSSSFAQSCYWVFLTDKAGSTFDPYAYFDAKAIERYQLNNADLYDISNYPLSSAYVSTISGLADEMVGETRWFNAVAVMATPDAISQIESLPFVREVKLIASDMQMAQYRNAVPANPQIKSDSVELDMQIRRMQGQLFKEKGIDGTGVRIAVFDGGFPHVNTHNAFQHLRDNNRIIKTWNFPNRKENVYGWNSHGTMVLSCITGIIDGTQLGLATGSEFLLARTEVESEPFKEEVWWMQAVEWADKNGADVINSSLGYGKDRHYTTQMDGTSYVAKAANMAARKGMLVCNSAGNEGDDDSWKIIITPADADSIITVGGITAWEGGYSHINFSSYGPTADGRLKPNVCNFGEATVANPKHDDETTDVYGTSFSSPLTAGFCACAWQTHRNLTAMQMKAEVEHSGELYPYYDYAFGYGVPQASYFLTDSHPAPKPTFIIADSGSYLAIHPQPGFQNGDMFMNVQNAKGLLHKYVNFYGPDSNEFVRVSKTTIGANTLNVHYFGYTQAYKLSDDDQLVAAADYQPDYFDFSRMTVGDTVDNIYDLSYNARTLADNKVNKWSKTTDNFLSLGTMLRTDLFGSEANASYWSPVFHEGSRFVFNPGVRWYNFGFGYEFVHTAFNLPSSEFDYTSASTSLPLLPADRTPRYDRMCLNEISLEAFQRVRLGPGTGLFWDLGIYGSCAWIREKHKFTLNSETQKTVVMNPESMNDYHLNYGIRTALRYKAFGLYGRYRVNGLLGGNAPSDDVSGTRVMPRLEVGLELKI